MFTTARSRSVRAAKAAALVVAAALALSACAGGTAEESPPEAPSDTLTVAVTTPPISMDPTTAGNGLPLAWYMSLTYEPLIARTPDGVVEPGLATDWAYSEDRLSFVLNLREGAKFSDGDELTADAVVAWLEHYKELGTYSGQWFSNVSGFEATEPLQVTVSLTAPDPLMPWALGQAGLAGAIVSPTGLANAEALGTETHGAGPYILDSDATVANSSYVFTKNPNYWNPDKQFYEEIILKVFTDQNSVLAALRSGQVQVAQGSAANAAAAEDAGFTVDYAPSGVVGLYLADIEGKLQPAFEDVRVRQALNYAIDREAITETIYGEFGIPTAQYVPEGVVGHLPELEDVYPYDPEKAKSLLAEAGYPDGFTFEVMEQPGFDGSDLLPQAMAAQFAEIGVTMEVTSYPSFADYITEFFNATYPASTYQFNYSEQLVALTGLATNPALYNYMEFTDAGANELAAEQKKFDTDSPEGIAAAEKSETYMVEQAFSVPVTSITAVMFSSPSVTNVEFGPFLPLPEFWQPAGE